MEEKVKKAMEELKEVIEIKENNDKQSEIIDKEIKVKVDEGFKYNNKMFAMDVESEEYQKLNAQKLENDKGIEELNQRKEELRLEWVKGIANIRNELNADIKAEQDKIDILDKKIEGMRTKIHENDSIRNWNIMYEDAEFEEEDTAKMVEELKPLLKEKEDMENKVKTMQQFAGSLSVDNIDKISKAFEKVVKEKERPEEKKPEAKNPEDKKPEEKKPEEKKPEEKITKLSEKDVEVIEPPKVLTKDDLQGDKSKEEKKPEEKKPEIKRLEDKSKGIRVEEKKAYDATRIVVEPAYDSITIYIKGEREPHVVNNIKELMKDGKNLKKHRLFSKTTLYDLGIKKSDPSILKALEALGREDLRNDYINSFVEPKDTIDGIQYLFHPTEKSDKKMMKQVKKYAKYAEGYGVAEITGLKKGRMDRVKDWFYARKRLKLASKFEKAQTEPTGTIESEQEKTPRENLGMDKVEINHEQAIEKVEGEVVKETPKQQTAQTRKRIERSDLTR